MNTTLAARLEECIRHELPSLSDAQAAELADIVAQLAAALAPERVYAFGSRARDDAGPHSDVDLMVVVPAADEPGYRRSQAAYRAITRRYLFPLDILVWTRAEFDRYLPNPATLPATILREGKRLYAA